MIRWNRFPNATISLNTFLGVSRRNVRPMHRSDDCGVWLHGENEGVFTFVLRDVLKRWEACKQQAIERGKVRAGLERTRFFHRVALQHLSGLVIVCRERGLPEMDVVAQGKRPLKILPIRELTPSNGVRGP